MMRRGTMRAVRLHGIGDLRVEEVPSPPTPGEGEVRLRVLAAGICGSDLHNFKTGQWIARLPVTPGHEFAAEVLEVGVCVTIIRP
jgi:(R,R)-butanediol dehydrogenase / meso-butanediol dehydrogenase / diacetyl reductase